MNSPTLDLLIDLVNRPSVTPDDGGCQALLAERLASLGFNAEHLNFHDTKNLWLRRGDVAPLFVFLGHTDVVPPGPLEAWRSPPFQAEIRDGVLYGRGAADMKGGIAAFVTALERFLQDCPRPRGSIALLLTSDEEGAATHGVVKVVEVLQQRQENIDWCLIGEPSCAEKIGDTLRVGRRGSLNAKLTVTGVQGHVAYPELADNPIHAFAPALQALCAEEWDQGNDFFPATRLQVSNINAGTGAENIIPGQLTALFNLRFSTELSAERIKTRAAAILDRFGLHYTIEWRLSGQPFLTAGGELISAAQQAVEQVCGFTANRDTGGGTSDGRFIAPTGAQVIELGPLNASIHKVNEHIPLSDLERLSAVYQRILVNLLG